MGIFKFPRATTDERMTLVLEIAEMIYDTDKKRFFGGDNFTLGGIEVGSNALDQHIQYVTLTNVDIQYKRVILNEVPPNILSIKLIPIGGIQQVYGIDFIVNGNVLSWDGLGLDNFLEENEQMVIIY